VTGPVLVLGGTGRLGLALTGELARRGIPFSAPPRTKIDLDFIDRLDAAVVRARPAALINAAGFTDVVAAEKREHRAAAARRNGEAPGILAAACARDGIAFVHVSTDYVFDGKARAPYTEDAEVNPIQVYGATKLEGERAVQRAHAEALIVRVSTLYGRSLHGRPAYVDTILAKARALAASGEGRLDVVEPPVASPTCATDVAPALLDLLARGASGIVNVVNDGAASRLELARRVVEIAGLAGRVQVHPRPDEPGALARPAYAVLDTTKLHSLLGRRLPPWKDALVSYLA
jgi:dTDP-4-dehydrorhamnose reductase